jgi:hypothetical protein
VKKAHAIAYWLIPAKDERELFRELIRILAREFDAPRFEPHLTLIAARQDRQPRNNRGSRTLSESPKKVLLQLKASPIRLRVRGISFSSKFTKTLFVRFAPSKSLDKLVVDLAGVRKSVRDPHLSLLYKKTSILAERELASTIKLPFREVVFDSIKAVRCISPTETRADVESWRVIATKTLR